MTKRLQTIKRKMLADREVRNAYEAWRDQFSLARELIAARARAGRTVKVPSVPFEEIALKIAI